MAFTLSRNLKLRLDDNLTANAKYNLSRLDLLGSTFLTDSTDSLNIRSRSSINILPDSADLGGNSTGGTVNIGSSSQSLDGVNLYTDVFNLSSTLGLLDQATSGTKYLRLKYQSNLSGSVDIGSDRALSFDLDGADRSLVLAGDFKVLVDAITFNAASGGSNVTLPTTGTLSTLAGIETLSNKTIDSGANTLTNISNSNIKASAGIVYSKLNLTNSLVDADIATGANIAYAKLALSGHLIDSDLSASAAIARSKIANGTGAYVVINGPSGQLSEEQYLSKARGGFGMDASSITLPASGTLATDTNTLTFTNKTINGINNTVSNISYSSLVLTGSIVNADISTSAAIAYSKLALTGSIVDADVSASASLSRAKIVATTPDHVIINNGSGTLSSEANLAITRGGTGAGTANAGLNNLLPSQSGNSGKVLRTDGSNTSWVAIAGSGTVTSVALSVPSELTVSGSPITTSGTLTLTKASQTNNTVWAAPDGSSGQPTFRALVLADLPANINHSTLANLSADDHTQYLTTGRADTWLATKTTDSLTEGSTNKYYLDERVDDRVAALIQNGTGINWSYNDPSNTLTGNVTLGAFTTSDLTEGANLYFTNERTDDRVAALIQNGTGITWSYNDPSNTLTGNVSLSGFSTTDLAEGTNLYFTTERAQDAVGGALTDTASIDFTYDDAGNSISAAVLPGGVNHNALLNYVANQHVDHSTVSIATSSTSGLSGGGNITTTRNLLVDPTQASTVAPALSDIVLFADVSNSNALANTTITNIANLITKKSVSIWSSGDGTTKAITHGFSDNDTTVNVYNIDTGEELMVDSIVRNTSSVTTLTSSQAPTGSGWRVIIRV